MRNMIENLIRRLEIERTFCFRKIEVDKDDLFKTTKNIQTGKILAYNLCIEELQKILDNSKDN